MREIWAQAPGADAPLAAHRFARASTRQPPESSEAASNPSEKKKKAVEPAPRLTNSTATRRLLNIMGKRGGGPSQPSPEESSATARAGKASPRASTASVAAAMTAARAVSSARR